MITLLKSRNFYVIALTVLISVLFVAIAVNAATTISTNVNTGGTLTVSGASTLNGNVTLGNEGTDVNLFTGTMQASTTALFTSGATLYSTLTMNGATGITLGSSATNLSSPVEGMIYYNSGSKVLRLYDGTSWFTVGTTTSGLTLAGTGNARIQLADLFTYMTLGTTTPSGLSMITLEATTTAAIPLTLRSFAGQTADLFRLFNAGNTELFAIDQNGNASTSAISLTSTLYVNGWATTTGSNGNIATAGTLTVDGNSTLGNAVGDSVTINGGTVAMGNFATTTVLTTVTPNVWSIATSSTITPTLSISGVASASGRVGVGTAAPNSTLEVIGTASSTRLVVGGDVTNGNVAGIIFGTCAVDPDNIATATSSLVTTSCTAAGVRSGDTVFVTPPSDLVSLDNWLVFEGASASTTAGFIEITVFNASTTAAINGPSRTWRWMAIR